MEKITLITKSSAGYELIDSGGEEKLERFGGVLLARPDPQALWEKKLVTSQWGVANGKFEREGKDGKWVGRSDLPKSWEIEFGGLKFFIKPTSFKHTGLFPEQLSNWQWGSELIKKAGREISDLKSWEIEFGGLKFFIKPTSFKHTGLFPEQLSNWQWGSELIKKAGREISDR